MNDIIPLSKNNDSKSNDTRYQPFLGKYTVKNVFAHSHQIFIELGTADEYFTRLTFNFMEFTPHKRLTAYLDLRHLQNVGKIDLFKQLYRDLGRYYQEQGLDVDKLVDPKNPFLRTSSYFGSVALHGHVVKPMERKTRINTVKEIYNSTEEYLLEEHVQFQEDIQPRNSLGNPNTSHKTLTLKKGLWVIMESCQNEEVGFINMQINCDESHEHKLIESIAQEILNFILKRYAKNLTYKDPNDYSFQRLKADHSFQFILDDIFKKYPQVATKDLEKILIESKPSFI